MKDVHWALHERRRVFRQAANARPVAVPRVGSEFTGRRGGTDVSSNATLQLQSCSIAEPGTPLRRNHAGTGKRPTLLQSAAAGAFSLLLVCTVVRPSAAGDPIRVDLTLAGTGVFTSDDDAQLEQRHRLPEGESGGIEQLEIERAFQGDGMLRLTGHALFEQHDYAVDFLVDSPKKGFVRAGYREFRTWSDASAGFFPQSGAAFFQPANDDLALDRGEAWITTGLRLPGRPKLDLSYRHKTRDGSKNSLVWGDSGQTGGFGTRSIVPAFLDVDETSDIVEGALSHRIDRTRLRADVHYESFDIDNARRVERNPGESGLDRFLTQENRHEGDLLRVRAHGESRFLKGKVVATSGFSYVRLDTDVSGSRIYGDRFGVPFDPGFANRQSLERGFLALDGRNELRLRTGNLNVMTMLHKDLRIVAALRASKESYDSQTSATETLLDPRVSPQAVENALLTDSSSNRTTFDESLEVRYLGLSRTAVYLTAEWQQADGDLIEQQTTGGVLSLDRKTNVDRTAQRYAVGGTWRPLSVLSLSGKYGYSLRENDYDHLIDSTDNRLGGDRYPAFFVSDEIESNVLNLRATWRPAGWLQISTRYDFDRTTFDSRGEGFASVESGQVTSHSVGASASWKPASYLYLQADGSYTDSQTDTPADALSGTAGLLVPDFDNDFWNASFLGGIALDDNTDVRLRYYFYRADNYSDNSSVSLPFGADAEEHGVAASLERRLSEKTSCRLIYGYVTSDDRTSGGHDDFSGHLVLVTVRTGF